MRGPVPINPASPWRKRASVKAIREEVAEGVHLARVPNATSFRTTERMSLPAVTLVEFYTPSETDALLESIEMLRGEDAGDDFVDPLVQRLTRDGVRTMF